MMPKQYKVLKSCRPEGFDKTVHPGQSIQFLGVNAEEIAAAAVRDGWVEPIADSKKDKAE